MAATPEQIKNTEKLVALLKEAVELSQRLGDTSGAKKYSEAIKEANKSTSATSDDLKSMTREVNDLRREWKEFSSDLSGARASFNSILDSINKSNTVVGQVATSVKNLGSIASDLQSIQSGYTELNEKNLSQIKEKVQREKLSLEIGRNLLEFKKSEIEQQIELNRNIAKDLTKSVEERNEARKSQIELNKKLNENNLALEETNNLLDEENSGYQALLKVIDQQEQKLKTVNKQFGLSGNLVKGLGETLNKIGLGGLANQLGIDEAVSKMKELANEGKMVDGVFVPTNSRVKILSEGLKSIGKSFIDTAFSFESVFSFILDATLKTSQNIADIRKQTGFSYGEATALNAEMQGVAIATGDAFITGDKLVKTYASLTNELGQSADILGNEALVSATQLEQKLGLSAKESAQLTVLSRLQGKNTEEVLDNTVAAVGAMNQQNKTAINVKAVLGDVANASEAIQVSLGKNPKAIAEAATAARQLGLSLSEVDNIANSLLDFESSISSELEAELLLGQDINLEKARLLALNNDLKGLSEELNKNEEIKAAFASGNRIQQEAAAKALGMSRDQLAKVALQQDLNNMAAEEFKNKYGEATYESLKATSASESFQEVLTKIQSVLGQIGMAFAPILDAIAAIVSLPFAPQIIAAAAAAILLGKSFKGVTETVKETFSTVKDLGKGILDFAKSASGAEGGIMSKVKAGFKGATGGGEGSIVETAGGVAEGAQSVAETGEKAKELAGIKPDLIKKTMKAIADGIKNFADPKVLGGALVLPIAAAGLVLFLPALPALFAIQLLKAKPLEMGLKAIGKGLSALGKMLMGPQAAAIGLGLVLIAGLGAALIPLAYAANLAAPAISAIGDVLVSAFTGLGTVVVAVGQALSIIISSVADSLIKMASPEIAIGLLSLVPALLTLGPALVGFGVGLSIAAASMAVTGMFGNPLEAILKLADSSSKLLDVNNAITGMSVAIRELANTLAEVDLEKLESITNPGIGGVALGLGTAAIEGVTSTVKSITGGGGEGGDGGLINEMVEVKEILKQILSKEGIVMLDSNKVGTSLNMGTYKLK
jgi:uncharacterized protein YoxC